MTQLLKSDIKWNWGEAQKKAFSKSKEALQSANVLVHYNDKYPLIVSCDASPYGVGAVVSHIMPDGSESPISFASRTLSDAERNYSQLDKDALALVYTVKNSTSIYTDVALFSLQTTNHF